MGAQKRKRNTNGGARKAKKNHVVSKPQKQPVFKATGVNSRPLLMRSIAKAAGLTGSNPSASRRDLIVSSDEYLSELIELIPADMYHPDDTKDETSWKQRKYHKTGNDKKMKMKLEQSKANRRQKFGTEEYLSVKEVGEKLDNPEDAESGSDNGADESEAGKLPKLDAAPAASRAEIKERMAKRRQELKAKRGGEKGPKQKKQRKRKSPASKQTVDDQVPTGGIAEESKPKKRAVEVEADGKNNTKSAEDIADSIRETVANRMGTISYGNLDITGEGKELFNGVEKKVVKGQKTRKILDVKKLLKEAESNQERMNKLKKDTNESVDRLSKDDKLFENMEQKAMGAKIRDDPKQLKKTLKRLEQKKKKSAKAWEQRLKVTEQAKRTAKEKRDSNVAKQEKSKLEAKLKRKGIQLPKEPSEKSSRSRQQRPGFEGKHKGFLNSTPKKSSKDTK